MNQYIISQRVSIAAGASVSFTGNSNASYFSFSPICIDADTAPLLVEFFEAPTTTANGTAITPVNMNRMSTATSLTSCYGSPTVSANGTLLYSQVIEGAKQQGGSSNRDYTFTLKPKTTYLFKVTNLTTGSANTTINMTWNESV